MAFNTTFYGNICADAETKEILGKNYANFRVAVNDRRHNTTNYVDVYYFIREGSSLMNYLKKGTAVLISGGIQINAYTNRDGIATPGISTFADELQLCGTPVQAQPAQQPVQAQPVQQAAQQPVQQPMPFAPANNALFGNDSF